MKMRHQTRLVEMAVIGGLCIASYNILAGESVTTDPTGIDLGGLTLTPGVYLAASPAQLKGTLTLDTLNNPHAQFIFQSGTTPTTTSGSVVDVIDGLSDPSVLSQVGKAARAHVVRGQPPGRPEHHDEHDVQDPVRSSDRVEAGFDPTTKPLCPCPVRSEQNRPLKRAASGRSSGEMYGSSVHPRRLPARSCQRRCAGLQTLVREDLLDEKLLQDGRDDVARLEVAGRE